MDCSEKKLFRFSPCSGCWLAGSCKLARPTWRARSLRKCGGCGLRSPSRSATWALALAQRGQRNHNPADCRQAARVWCVRVVARSHCRRGGPPDGKRWEIRILQTPESEKLAVYLDLTENALSPQPVLTTPANPPQAPIHSPAPARPPPLTPPKQNLPAPHPAGSTAVGPDSQPATAHPAVARSTPQAPLLAAPKPTSATSPSLPAGQAHATPPAQPQPSACTPAAQPAKEPTRVTAAQLAKRIGLPVNVALEALRNRGFPFLRDNTVVNATIAEHLRTTKAEYDRLRPLQPIQFPEAKPSRPESITDFIQKATEQPPDAPEQAVAGRRMV